MDLNSLAYILGENTENEGLKFTVQSYVFGPLWGNESTLTCIYDMSRPTHIINQLQEP